LSLRDFIEQYDRPCKPVIVTDALEDWPAREKWTLEKLQARFQSTLFKTDEVCDGKKIKMPFDKYVQYFKQQRDEDPIYLFDPDFADTAPDLLTDYTVPPYFREDLLAVLGEEKRPLYRWWVIGPQRSGSCFHVDPYKTSAWNALLCGRKRWILYPPNVVPPGVEEDTDSDGEKEYDAPEPMKYMLDEYSKLPRSNSAPGTVRPIECILEAGEVIFVPTGWWHMVLNLTDTIAVTQNVMNQQNFRIVYKDIRSDDRKMKKRLRRKLKKLHPDIYTKFLKKGKNSKEQQQRGKKSVMQS